MKSYKGKHRKSPGGYKPGPLKLARRRPIYAALSDPLRGQLEALEASGQARPHRWAWEGPAGCFLALWTPGPAGREAQFYRANDYPPGLDCVGPRPGSSLGTVLRRLAAGVG